jgi:prepilin-type N-terminal cleavage/methylation domain-containing protein
MRRANSKAGMTLVEVLIAVVLVSVAASLVYNGGFYSYRILMRSRARLEAQGIAFDKLWQLFNAPLDSLPSLAVSGSEPTPEDGAFPSGGLVRFAVMPETNAPLSSIDYWEITVQVWAPSNSILFSVMNDDGTVQAAYPDPLAEYTLLRYPGDR